MTKKYNLFFILLVAVCFCAANQAKAGCDGFYMAGRGGLAMYKIDEGKSKTNNASDYSGQVGEKARFSVEAEGENLSYQWQYLKDDQWINLGGSTAVTAEYSITIKDNHNNRNYRCVITDANDQTVISDTAVLHVVVPPKELAIITQPSDYTGAVGEKARFSVVAEGDGLSYQWQYLKDNQWINLSGSTAVTDHEVYMGLRYVF